MSVTKVPSPVVNRIAGYIGAEITGVDLSAPMDAEVAKRIRTALLEHKVVFFRGQRLDHESQLAFARQLGDPTIAHPHEDQPIPGYPEIHTVDPQRDRAKYGHAFQYELRRRQQSAITGWHTDLTPMVNPPAISILRADAVPEFGGDTQWTNLQAAYEDLSAPLKRLADCLRAVHRFRTLPARAGSQVTHSSNAKRNIAEHPVVRVHPETGQRALFVNPSFTSHIVGLTAIESRTILELLFSHLTRPEFTMRFRWCPGDVAIWDNRATAHLAPTDLPDVYFARRMYRVTLVGEPPVGVDGRESSLVAGEPFVAASQTSTAGAAAVDTRPSAAA